jgi:hypothetical protein
MTQIIDVSQAETSENAQIKLLAASAQPGRPHILFE